MNKADEKYPVGALVKKIRLIVDNWDDNLLYGHEKEDEKRICVRYAASDFPFFKALGEQLFAGATVNILSSNVAENDENGTSIFYPKFIVLLPDFLIDISTLSHCVQPQGAHPMNYLIHKFEPSVKSPAILLGNAANQFMDDCVNADQLCDTPEKAQALYLTSIRKNFRDFAVEYAACKTSEIGATFFEQTRMHFQHILQIVEHRLDTPAIGIQRNNIQLEPSFFCEAMGLQGRMDVLTNDLRHIIELKSGKADEYRGHVAGTKSDHKLQMALYKEILFYNLDIPREEISTLLLYSRYPILANENEPKEVLQKAIALRNGIVHNEWLLRNGHSRELIASMDEKTLNERQLDGFFYTTYIQPPIVRVIDTLKGAKGLERDYFHTFLTFLEREQFLAKTGNGTAGSGIGFAETWNATTEQKLANGTILTHLKMKPIFETEKAGVEHIELISEPNEDGYTPNFRKGDTVLFYERNTAADNATNRQVFRGTIEKIEGETIRLQLRFRQRNPNIFHTKSYFAMESDYMDNGFTQAYRGLYLLLQTSAKRKDLLLGKRQPEFSDYQKLAINFQNERVAGIVQKSVRAKDYFLLIGPPGTGKTSVALRAMVEEFLAEKKQLLLMAYTNQAVDEICEMLEQLPSAPNYLRIGQELNCNAQFASHLIKNATNKMQKRSEISTFIKVTPIIVGTVSSLTGKPELFRLKQFDVALIDEASQLLEPQLLPLLCAKHTERKYAIRKFVLIGDQKQLPAVVMQTPEESCVENEALRSIGLTNCRNSLFERLYNIAQRNGQEQAFSMLDKQGRMHPAISDFVNRTFYGNHLGIVPLKHQTSTLGLPRHGMSAWETFVAGTRFGFINQTKILRSRNPKINVREAEIVKNLLQTLSTLYAENGQPLDMSKDVGIIVPFRNQIARIRKTLQETETFDNEEITIDTVERYQGSQRNIIIFCTTVSSTDLLDTLSAPVETDGEQVDRKLNVALTRARKQLFIVGHKALLAQCAAYKTLLDYVAKSAVEGVTEIDV